MIPRGRRGRPPVSAIPAVRPLPSVRRSSALWWLGAGAPEYRRTEATKCFIAAGVVLAMSWPPRHCQPGGPSGDERQLVGQKPRFNPVKGDGTPLQPRWASFSSSFAVWVPQFSSPTPESATPYSLPGARYRRVLALTRRRWTRCAYRSIQHCRLFPPRPDPGQFQDILQRALTKTSSR